MRQKINNFFLNDNIILSIIIINVIVIFLQESKVNFVAFVYFDSIITILFFIEMGVKLKHFGIKNYFKSKLNTIDFVIVALSGISLVFAFWNTSFISLHFLLILRTFRIFKVFRLIKFFPNARKIQTALTHAIKSSYIIFIGFFIIIAIFSLISCLLFQAASPNFFATPLDAFYSIFRLFTIEGWYEIPDAVANGFSSPYTSTIVKIYFGVLLLIGGIIGLSFVNSVFVDAMLADNNDETNEEIEKLQKKIDELHKKIDKLIEK